MRSTFYMLLFTTIGICVCSYPARAAFILDDFDDPAETISPEMFDEFAFTENVGSLNATRKIRIAGGRGDPIGRLDSGVSASSILTVDISRLDSFADARTRVSFQTNFDFLPIDFIGGNSNDAFFLDFRQMTSEIPPSLFKILLNDTNKYFVYIDTADYRSSESFTLMVPFDRFTLRDGNPGLPDYRTIQSFNLEIRASHLFGGGPDPLNFFVELERIRVGRIPEPSTLSIAFSWILLTKFPRQHR